MILIPIVHAIILTILLWQEGKEFVRRVPSFGEILSVEVCAMRRDMLSIQHAPLSPALSLSLAAIITQTELASFLIPVVCRFSLLPDEIPKMCPVFVFPRVLKLVGYRDFFCFILQSGGLDLMYRCESCDCSDGEN